MGQTAQEILREALLNQMEKEASGVPSTEQIRRMHRFSDRFLKYMEQLIKREEEKQKKKRVPFAGQKNLIGKKSVMRIAAACIVCVIAISSGWWGLHAFLGGSGSKDSTNSAGMAQMESTEMSPEEAFEESEESGAGAYGDLSEMWITADDISRVEVTGDIIEHEQDRNSNDLEAARSLYANEKQTQKLVTILNGMTLKEVVSAEDADDLPLAEFSVTKTDESVMNISVYDSKIVIDGVRYEAGQEICEQLRILAEDIRETAGEE